VGVVAISNSISLVRFSRLKKKKERKVWSLEMKWVGVFIVFFYIKFENYKK